MMRFYIAVLGAVLLVGCGGHTSIVPRPTEQLEPLPPVNTPGCFECGEEDIKNEVSMSKGL